MTLRVVELEVYSQDFSMLQVNPNDAAEREPAPWVRLKAECAACDTRALAFYSSARPEDILQVWLLLLARALSLCTLPPPLSLSAGTLSLSLLLYHSLSVCTPPLHRSSLTPTHIHPHAHTSCRSGCTTKTCQRTS